jgi:hypothetical protein
MQDNRVMFKAHGCDDEVGRGQRQALSAKGESEFINVFPGGLGDGEYVETLQFDSQVVALGFGSATLEEFQDHNGAGGRETGRDAMFEEIFELRMAGSPEAGDPCGGIHQDALSRHGASSLTL